MSSPTVPVRLTVPGETRVDQGGVHAESVELHGLVQLHGHSLHVEWSGIRRVMDAGRVVRSLEESVPVSAVQIPVARIARLRLRGRWWRPALELWPADRAAFAGIPGGTGECLVLRLARRDWRLAEELRANLELEQAEAMLRAAEAPPELPPA